MHAQHHRAGVCAQTGAPSLHPQDDPPVLPSLVMTLRRSRHPLRRSRHPLPGPRRRRPPPAHRDVAARAS